MSRYLPIFAAAILAWPGPAPGADWTAYSSENFTVYSDARESRVLNTLENFEKFRTVMLTLLNLPDEPENERLKIVMLDRWLDFNRVKGNLNAIGFFYHSVFGPRMIVGPGDDTEENQRILFHEYVHYLMNQRVAVNHPRWYAEGIAEVFETVEFRKDVIVVGSSDRDLDLGLSNVRLMLGLDYPDDWIHYQIAWLMVHYLLIDSYQDPAKSRQLADYLRRYDAGEDPLEAFELSFGMTTEDMTKELNSFTRGRTIQTLRLPQFEYTGRIEKRALDPGEELYLLGDISVEMGEHDSAHAYFDDFVDMELESPLADKVDARRAIAYIHEDRIEEGDATVRELMADRPSDPDVLADLAHYSYDRFLHAARNDEPWAVDHLNRSIALGETVVAASPTDLEALYYLGVSYELDGDLQRAADTLLAFYDISPSVAPLNLALARVLTKGNQAELATYLISRVISATDSTETRTRLLEIQRQISSDDFDVATADEIF